MTEIIMIRMNDSAQNILDGQITVQVIPYNVLEIGCQGQAQRRLAVWSLSLQTKQ